MAIENSLSRCFKRLKASGAAVSDEARAKLIAGAVIGTPRPRGTSKNTILGLLNEPRLYKKQQYSALRAAMTVVLDGNVGDIFEGDELQRSIDLGPVRGVWLLIHLKHALEANGEPSTKIRRALLWYKDDSVEIIGPGTLWQGTHAPMSGDRPFRQIEAQTETFPYDYMRAFLYHPTNVAHTQTMYQRGIITGTASGKHEDELASAIVGSRCILRRLDNLTKVIEQTPERWQATEDLRAAYCGYDSLPQVRDGTYTKIGSGQPAEEWHTHYSDFVQMLFEGSEKSWGSLVYTRSETRRENAAPVEGIASVPGHQLMPAADE